MKACPGCTCEEVKEAKSKVYRKKKDEVFNYLSFHLGSGGQPNDKIAKELCEVHAELKNRLGEK